mgnify:CR=1 FL=1
MTNKIRTAQSPVAVHYDVLDQSGVATTLGGLIQVTLTAPQAAAFVAAVQAIVDAKVAVDLAAARTQLTNTQAT